MKNLNITDLQVEILEKIFSYLPGEKKKLTEVCNRFNDIIGSSFNLMNSFRIKWNEKSYGKQLKGTEFYWYNQTHKIVRAILSSRRKYRNVNLGGIQEMTDDILCFIVINRNSLRSITFTACKLKVSDFATVLSIVSNNLEEIFFEDETEFIDNYIEIPMRLPNLKNISIEEIGELIAPILKYFFGADKVEKFNLSNCCNEPRELMCSLKGIKTLKLDCDNDGYIFEDNYLAANATFQLENIHVLCGGLCDDPANTNFLNFLYTQKNSLKKVTISNCYVDGKIITACYCMDQLKELILNPFRFSIYQKIKAKSESITKLSIDRSDSDDEDIRNESKIICNLVKNCPNLQVLYLRFVNIQYKFALILQQKLRYLNEILFYDCDLLPMTFPTVKVMTFGISSKRGEEYTESNYGLVLKHLQANQQLSRVDLPSKITSNFMYADTMSLLNLDKISFNDYEFN